MKNLKRNYFTLQKLKEFKETLRKGKRDALVETKKCENNVDRVRNKGFPFVALINDHYVRKVKDQVIKDFNFKILTARS